MGQGLAWGTSSSLLRPFTSEVCSVLIHLLCCLGTCCLHFSAFGQKDLPVTARQRHKICPGPALSYRS